MSRILWMFVDLVLKNVFWDFEIIFNGLSEYRTVEYAILSSPEHLVGYVYSKYVHRVIE